MILIGFILKENCIIHFVVSNNLVGALHDILGYFPSAKKNLSAIEISVQYMASSKHSMEIL